MEKKLIWQLILPSFVTLLVIILSLLIAAKQHYGSPALRGTIETFLIFILPMLPIISGVITKDKIGAILLGVMPFFWTLYCSIICSFRFFYLYEMVNQRHSFLAYFNYNCGLRRLFCFTKAKKLFFNRVQFVCFMDIGFLFGYRLSNILEKGRKMILMSGNRKKSICLMVLGGKNRKAFIV